MSLLIGASSGLQGAAGASAGGSGDLGETIDQSLRFSDSVLHRDFSATATSNTTGTFSFWVKKAGQAAEQTIVMRDGNHWFAAFPNTDEFSARRTGAGFSAFGSAKYRDPSAWYHFVVSINSNTATTYLNGTQISTTVTTDDIFTSGTNSFRIGSESTSAASSNLEGYLAEFIFVDGQALDEEDFGRYNDDGVWVPIEYTGTFGTNGYHLDFADSSNLGNDVSGNNNDFTAVGFNTSAIVNRSKGLDYTNTDVNDTNEGPGALFEGSTSPALFTAGGGTLDLGDLGTALGTGVSTIVIENYPRLGTNTLTVNSSSQTTTGNSWHTTTFNHDGSAITTFTIAGTDTANWGIRKITVDGTELTENVVNDIDYRDTPTSNYATFNPIINNDEPTFAECNLKADGMNNGTVFATQKLPDKHLYCEFMYPNGGNTGDRFGMGVADAEDEFEKGAASDADYSYMIAYSNNGGHKEGKIYNHSSTASQTSLTQLGSNQILGVEWRGDLSTRQVKFYINGTQVGNAENVPTGKEYYFAAHRSGGSNPPDMRVNFGQMEFEAAPAGITAADNGMQTNLLTEPTIKNGKDYFDVLTWTGDGASPKTRTGLEFTPDFVWIKDRNNTFTIGHRLYDSVRGAGVDKHLDSANTTAEGSGNDGEFGFVTGFVEGGFTTEAGSSGDDYVNDTSVNYVAWCWKAGGTAASNSDGTITSSVSANTDAGFSIVSFTGTNAAATVGHGLNSAPEMIIFKNRDISAFWPVYHKDIVSATGNYLALNASDNNQSNSNIFNNTAPTSSVFSVGASSASNGSGDDMIAYCWHSVEGFSKIGNYTGDGLSDGPFIYTGFSVHWLLVKCATNGGTDALSWHLIDTTRQPINPNGKPLHPNTNGAEDDFTSAVVDLLSNGFKIRCSPDQYNKSSANYVYMAFASNPFGGENAPPATAR